MGKLTEIFSATYYVFWVETFVILSILVFVLYISYSLNLFKRD